jgi:N-acetylglucosamine malate deacetylase 1
MSELDFAKKGPLLFIGCHPDDIELGCGGLLNRISKKTPIYVVILSKNQKNPSNKNLLKEQKISLKTLGINEKETILADFITREFSYSRQEICDFLWKINKKINPTCVFIPPMDLHQDHQVCHNESLRVFRTKSIIEYQIPRSESNRKSLMYVKLSKKDLDMKLKALSYYKTYKNKNYYEKSSIVSKCQSAGIRLEIPLCESFNIISLVV